MLPIILYENIFRDGTLTASGTSTDDDYDVDYLVDYHSYTKWKADGITDPWVAIELGTAASPDCLGIYNHNFNEVGGTIKLQHDSDDNDVWTDIETITPNGTYPIIITFDPVDGGSTKYRIFFDTPTLAPEMAVIFLGTKIEFPYPPESPVTSLEEGVRGSTEISEGGHTLGSLIDFFPNDINHNFKNITRTWFDTYFRPFWFNHARYRIHFFYAVDLDNRPNDINYFRISDNMTFKETLTILSLTDELLLSFTGISSDQNFVPFLES